MSNYNNVSDNTELLTNILISAPQNLIVQDALTKAYSVFKSHKHILVSVSGGSDSDIIVDIASKLDPEHKKVDYCFFDTGLESSASKEHLLYLEKRYGIYINRVRPKKPIPVIAKEEHPFLSKYCSEMIHRLQYNNFDFRNGNRTYEELIKEYPNCQSALAWWCNLRYSPALRIDGRKYLKEFLISNPPTFKISSACCHEAKIKTSETFIKNGGYDLSVIGTRKAEGGIRSASTNCFVPAGKTRAYDVYKPIFWFSSKDKKEYEEHFCIEHSAAYTKYDLTRTGCCACPFSSDFEQELETMRRYEPMLTSASENIFKDSYAYTKAYFDFRDDMVRLSKQFQTAA